MTNSKEPYSFSSSLCKLQQEIDYDTAKSLTVFIDNGHGKETKGKRSPDGVFREWAWTRDTAGILAETLRALGFGVVMVCPEENDITLTERCRRINNTIDKEGGRALKYISISIHNNAAGSGKEWLDARGWEVYIFNGYVLPQSRSLATDMAAAAKNAGFKIRQASKTQPYKQKNLAMVRMPNCPAILVEHFFMDNKDDYNYLLSAASIYDCATVLAEGVIRYANEIKNGR